MALMKIMFFSPGSIFLSDHIPKKLSIDPEKLSDFERKSLRDAFLILGNAQKFLKYRYQPGRAN